MGEVWGSALMSPPPTPAPSLTPAPKQAPSSGGSCPYSTRRPPICTCSSFPAVCPHDHGLLPTALSDSSAHRPVLSPLRPECCFPITILYIALLPRNCSLTQDRHLENKDRTPPLSVGRSLVQVLPCLLPPLFPSLSPDPLYHDSTPLPVCSRGCTAWPAPLLSR